MKEQLMSTTRSIGITKPLSSIQLKYIPSECKMRSSCGFCHTDHDPRLDPNAKEFIPRPPARDLENTAPMFLSDGPPYVLPYNGPWHRTYGGSAWWHRRPPASSHMSTAVPAAESVHMNGGRPNVRGCAVVGAGPPAGNLVKGDRPLACAEPRPVKPSSPPPSDPSPPAAEGQLREELRQLRLKAFQGEAELPPRCDVAAVSPAACVVEINSVSISPPKSDVILSADVPDSPRSADSIVFQSGSLASDFLERCVVSPSQCSDSTKPRRSSQCRDSTSRDPRPTCRAQSAAATATCSPSSPSTSTSAAGASPDCDPAACRGWRRASSGASDSESSDDSSEDDSAASDGEWDGSPAAGCFLPGSSVDSDSDFIQFVREDEPCCPSPLVQPCCPTLPVRPCCPTQPSLPLTPVFGPSPGDQVDSGLSVETDSDSSDSGAEGDSSDDELSDGDEDESCEPCRSASEGTCAVHQRIAEANRQLEAWCAAPPLQTPRTAKVRFHSGDRLATVHAAPDYDRTIASDLLDQQRQRDRLRVWRQEVERQVAPVLAAVLAPEHRRRVLAQRPELLRGGDR